MRLLSLQAAIRRIFINWGKIRNNFGSVIAQLLWWSCIDWWDFLLFIFGQWMNLKFFILYEKNCGNFCISWKAWKAFNFFFLFSSSSIDNGESFPHTKENSRKFRNKKKSFFFVSITHRSISGEIEQMKIRNSLNLFSHSMLSSIHFIFINTKYNENENHENWKFVSSKKYEWKKEREKYENNNTTMSWGKIFSFSIGASLSTNQSQMLDIAWGTRTFESLYYKSRFHFHFLLPSKSMISFNLNLTGKWITRRKWNWSKRVGRMRWTTCDYREEILEIL